MRLAISTAVMEGRGLAEVVGLAKRLGVEGVELEGLPEDVGEAGRIAREAGVELACLSTSAAFADNTADAMVSGGVVRADIDAAAEMGCPMVRMLDIAGGGAREGEVLRFGEFLMPLAEYALERGVVLVVENALSLRTARAMWAVMDRVGHPALGVCWDAGSAMGVGETPAQSVPVLNSRIRHVRVRDVGGDVQVEGLLKRLRGVGYAGFVTLAYAGVGEEGLGEAVKKVRGWTRAAVGKGKR